MQDKNRKCKRNSFSYARFVSPQFKKNRKKGYQPGEEDSGQYFNTVAIGVENDTFVIAVAGGTRLADDLKPVVF